MTATCRDQRARRPARGGSLSAMRLWWRTRCHRRAPTARASISICCLRRPLRAARPAAATRLHDRRRARARRRHRREPARAHDVKRRMLRACRYTIRRVVAIYEKVPDGAHPKSSSRRRISFRPRERTIVRRMFAYRNESLPSLRASPESKCGTSSAPGVSPDMFGPVLERGAGARPPRSRDDDGSNAKVAVKIRLVGSRAVARNRRLSGGTISLDRSRTPSWRDERSLPVSARARPPFRAGTVLLPSTFTPREGRDGEACTKPTRSSRRSNQAPNKKRDTDRVLGGHKAAASKMKQNGQLFASLSGHGGMVPKHGHDLRPTARWKHGVCTMANISMRALRRADEAIC